MRDTERDSTSFHKKLHVILFFAFLCHKNLPQWWIYFFLHIDKDQTLLMQYFTAICTKCTRTNASWRNTTNLFFLSFKIVSSSSMQRFQQVFGSKLFSVIGMIHVRALPGSFNWAIRNDELTFNGRFSGRDTKVWWKLQRYYWTGSARSEYLQKTQCRKWRTVFDVSIILSFETSSIRHWNDMS